MQLKRYNDKKEEIPVAYFFFFLNKIFHTSSIYPITLFVF